MTDKPKVYKCPYCHQEMSRNQFKKHSTMKCPARRPKTADEIFMEEETKISIEKGHFIVDALNLCEWEYPPTIYPLLSVLKELLNRGSTFTVLFSEDTIDHLYPYTSMDSIKRITRDIYEPCINEFPDRFKVIPAQSLSNHLVREAKDSQGIIITNNQDSIRLARKATPCPVTVVRGKINVKEYIRGGKRNSKRKHIYTNEQEAKIKTSTIIIPSMRLSIDLSHKNELISWWDIRALIKPQKEEIPVSNPIDFLDSQSSSISETEIVELNWRFLGGEATIHRFKILLDHFKELKRANPQRIYEISRLEWIYNLRPETIYIGIEEFDGYIAFSFYKERLTVLECPVVGNAIYIIRGPWKELSKRNRKDLLWLFPKRVQRLIHVPGWKIEIEQIVKQFKPK